MDILLFNVTDYVESFFFYFLITQQFFVHCACCQHFDPASHALSLSTLESESSNQHSSRFSLTSRVSIQLASFGSCLVRGIQLPFFVKLYSIVVALSHPWPAIFSDSLNIRQLLSASAQPTLLLQMSLADTPVCDVLWLGPLCLAQK